MEEKDNLVPIIIPSYEPDDRLIVLLESIKKANIGPIILVNDGSDSNYDHYFDKAEKIISDIGGKVIHHRENKGKGRALKTAFSYVIDTYKNAIGVVTIDSDGQHSAPCTMKVIEALKNNSSSLILGTRNFDLDNVPWKSRLGNKITSFVFGFITNMKITDTQTGLRGIPKSFMEELLDVEGERFEFETKMLLESYNKYPIIEVEIETIYDSKENHQSHFNPFKDSIKIYKILGKKFLLYIFSSLFSSLIDLILFTIFIYVFKKNNISAYILISTVLSRLISCSVNFGINYKKVFNSNKTIKTTITKYGVLALIQMLTSAGLVTLFAKLFIATSESLIKVVVDTILFFVSYKLQQRLIF